MAGGGGGGQPTQSTSYQTNLPEYAKPYVETMLGATQKQLFNTQAGPEGTTEITGFKPYTPYSANPADYFAGPSSLQTSAYNAAAQLQSPTQYQVGTQLAGTSGLGQLGTARQAGMYGQQGVGLGQMGAMAAMPAFGAGQQYASQVTDPSQVGAYMSPYQQQVTDVAKAAAVREAQIANTAGNLASARQGTYGGARQALAQAERERGLLSNLSNIQATGSQNAYNQAIQNMQYGQNLGLQGIQTGLQGIGMGLQGTAQGLQGVGAQQAGYAGAGQAASTLGQLGSAQQAADVQNIGLQNQLGQQQQQYQQNIINQAIQDYATQQQYPMMQLGFMSNMLRGLPMQATTTQQYQAQPSLATQAISGLGTAAGAYKAFGFKKGGAVKGLASGGEVPGYAGGAMIEGMKAKLEMIADAPNGEKQLAQIRDSSPSVEMRKLAAEVLMEKQMENQAAQQAQQSIAQDQAPRGLAALPAPSMDALSAASGGIIAFADQGAVQYDPNRAYDDPYEVLSDAEFLAREKARRAAAGISESPVSQEQRDYWAKQKGLLPQLQEQATGMNMIDFFSKMNRAGPIIKAATEAAGEALPGITARKKELTAREQEIMKSTADLDTLERADKMGILKLSDADRKSALDRQEKKDVAEIAARERATDLDRTTTAIFNDLVTNQKMDPNNPATKATARRMAIEQTGLAYQKLDAASSEKMYRALKDDKEIKTLRRNQMQYEEGSKEYRELEGRITAREQQIRNDFATGQSTSGGTPGAPKPAEKVDGSGKFPVGTVNNPMPMPTKQDELKKGKVYATSRGPATWNGTAFEQ